MSKKKLPTWQVPHLEDGSIPYYINDYVRDGVPHYYKIQVGWVPITLSDNHTPFQATIQIEGYSRGRSAANFDVANVETGATYTIFMTDMLDIILSENIYKGLVVGMWRPVKRGANFGIAMVKEDESEKDSK